MDVFNFILSVLVFAGFIGILAAPEETKWDKVSVVAFVVGALLLAAAVFGDGIGFIIWRV